MVIPFRRSSPDSTDLHTIYLSLPLLQSEWDGSRSPAKNVEQAQSKAMFAVAADVRGTSVAALLDQLAMEELCLNASRLRLHESLSKGQYRLIKGLERREPKATTIVAALRESTKRVDLVLHCDLWKWLASDPLQFGESASYSHLVEFACGYPVPIPPVLEISDAARYIGDLLPNEYDDDCSMLHMGIYCLLVAEATGNLVQYILTYEALFDRYLSLDLDCVASVIWIEVLAHLNRWFRVLHLFKWGFGGEDELLAKCMALEDCGIRLRVKRDCGRVQIEREYPLVPNAIKKFPRICLPDSGQVLARMIDG